MDVVSTHFLVSSLSILLCLGFKINYFFCIYFRYLNHKIEDLDHGDLYGFFEPQSIQKSGNKKIDCQNYMTERIRSSPKQFYLAPYVDQ